MVRTQISLTDEQHAAVTSLAESRGVSMSALIREAVDDLVRRCGRTAAEALLELSDEFARPLGGDLAERHDELLGEEPW